jgi:hypothetical protein
MFFTVSYQLVQARITELRDQAQRVTPAGGTGRRGRQRMRPAKAEPGPAHAVHAAHPAHPTVAADAPAR